MLPHPSRNALKKFAAFVHERHAIYKRRHVDFLPRPWTKDPVLAGFRFTNVYRELDTVTKWIGANWRGMYSGDKDLWFAMAVARLINWPETLAELGYPVPWTAAKAAKLVRVASRRSGAKQKVFTSAYIINQAVTGGYGMGKAEYLAKVVFPDLWAKREAIRPRKGDTLEAFHARLMAGYGMGTFLAAQVVADLKYTGSMLPLSIAPDWHTWAASGPGSRRGLNILLGVDPKTPLRESQWREIVQAAQKDFNENYRDVNILDEPLHAQDFQNCLCEYSKYVRGHSRQRYEGKI